MMFKFVTVACLVTMLVELLIVLLFFLVNIKKRSRRIEFFRSFKKGKCAVIYLTAVPLYCIGYLYAGQDFLKAFFNAVSKSVTLVVLKYDIGNIEALMSREPLYKFTIYFCFVLVGLNAIIFTLSLVKQYFWCTIQSIKSAMTKKDKLLIFGYNQNNISLYLSDKKRNKAIIDDISKKDREQLYLKDISFVSSPSFEAILTRLFRPRKQFDREYIIVVNTSDDEKNIHICQEILDNINLLSDEVQEKLFFKMKVFVFGDPKYEAIYEKIVTRAYGCIHYVNKYQKIAMDFIDRYPFTKFMDEEQIDYKTSLIKEDVDINALFIGFGKTNRQLFLTSVANNQFLTSGEDDPRLKQVKYYIFDKDDAQNNKNLNHNYYRFKHECAGLNKADYLPLPTEPAKEEYYKLDINDCDFYNRIRSVVTCNTRDVNFVIIAFGTDLENIDMAQKLVEKRKEWNVRNLVIFVKVRIWHKEQTLLKETGCYFIGNEKDVVYSIDKLNNDSIFRMAQMRNETYRLEYNIKHPKDKQELIVDDACIKKNQYEAYTEWYKKIPQMERESSLYGCLSLRSKLNLMGLDYCKIDASDEPGMGEDEYITYYAGDDKPDTSKYKVTINGKKIVSYTLHFPPSRRRNMAVHEHLRWNSFMISKGIVPSSRMQIVNEKIIKEGKEVNNNGKNYAVRRHGNLTTFEGLVEFRQLVTARDIGSEEEENDVIKYDYQLLDDAYWLLNANGYKIIRNVKLK